MPEPEPEEEKKQILFSFDTNSIDYISGAWQKIIEYYASNQQNKYLDLYINIGQNIYKEPIWKPKYLAKDEIHINYINHLASNPVHVLQQPHYYRNMFTILN